MKFQAGSELVIAQGVGRSRVLFAALPAQFRVERKRTF